MTQFGVPSFAFVDLAAFWVAWGEIDQEREQSFYVAARDFWQSFDTGMTASRDNITDLRQYMELHSNWTSLDRLGRPRPDAASTAFYGRVDAGIQSIQTWLNGGPSGVRDRFDELTTRLPEDLVAVDGHKATLLGQQKIEDVAAPGRGLVASYTMVPIAEQDGRVRVPAGAADQLRHAVEDTVRRRDELRALFGQLVTELNRLPDNVRWAGPTMVAAQAPSGGNPSGSPVPGGPGSAPGGPGSETGAPTGAGPEAVATQESTPTTGGDQPSADPPGTDQPGVPATDQPGIEDLSTPPLPSDPELAATPSATMAPTTTPLPSSTSSLPTTTSVSMPVSPGTSSASSPFPLTSTAFSPPRVVDGPRGGTPSASVAEKSPTLPRGTAAGASSDSGRGNGFYPPMMPMSPLSGGGGSGVKPGQAEFTGGRIRQAGDSRRAGLRPQLLGRAGESVDEPHTEDQVGDVLDEELWQVPGAAPATPPEPRSRRR